MVKTNRSGAWCMLAATILASVGIAVGSIYEDNSVSAATSGLAMAATIQPSMTLAIDNDSPTLSITPSSTGTFGATSVTVRAYSNGSIGYTLTMTASSTTLDGSNSNNIPTLTTAATCTGGDTCTSSNFAVGRWGIAIGAGAYSPVSTSTTNLLTVENTTTTVLPNVNNTNNVKTIYLGANLDLNTPTDEYSTTVNFALVSSTIAQHSVTFNYDPNFTSFAIEDANGNTVTPESTGTNTKTYILDYAGTYTIVASYANLYGLGTMSVSSGSGFANSDALTYTVGGAGTVVLTSKIQCNPSGTTLGTSTSSDIICMQDITNSNRAGIIGAMTASTNYTLYDSRDGNAYTVAKLADGKVWMTKNLNITGGTALSASDTNITDDYIASFETSNNLTKVGSTITLPDSATKNDNNNNLTSGVQFGSNDYSYIYNSGIYTDCGASGQNKPCYSYYSWDVATLGSGRSISTEDTDASYSVCPKGWKLPTSRTTSATDWQTASDFYGLTHQYGDNDFYSQAGSSTVPNFLLAGSYGSGTFYDGGVSGRYWSATSSDDTRAHNLSFTSESVSSYDYSNRGSGLGIRCLLITE